MARQPRASVPRVEPSVHDVLGAGPPIDPVELALSRAALTRRFFPTLSEGAEDSLVRVDRFEILAVLGQGSMGRVYAARDPTLARSVALKLIRADAPGTDGGDELWREHLLREARAMARVAHPNVLAIHEVGVHEGQVFLAMEYVEGGDLRAWLRAESRPRAAIHDVFEQAAEGLSAAHRAGLVHRDFKPDNVLVGDDGRVRVADFGLARVDPSALVTSDPSALVMSDPSALVTSDSAQGEHATTTAAGTPAYMAPEQRDGRRGDARTDGFAFCVALHEALTGARPRPAGPGEPLALDVAELQGWERALLERGLAQRPEDRFADMDALLSALRGGRARPRRRRRATVVGLAALAVAIGFVGVANRRPEPAPVCTEQRALAGIEQAWGTERRARLKERFATLDAAWAGATFEAAAARLDGYAEAWRAGWLDNCEASHVRGEQSARALDLRSSCLERRRTHLAVLVDRLHEDPDRYAERALRAIDELPPVAACGDAEALAAVVPDPERPALAEAVASGRDRVSAIRVSLDGGDYERATREFEAARASADEALAHRPFAAELAIVEGRVRFHAGELDAAAEALERGFVDGIAGRHHDAAAEAAIRLVLVLGDEVDDREAAERWAVFAEATIVALGGDPRLEGWLANNLGNARQRWGDYDGALARYAEAERHWAPLGRTIDLAGLANNRGNALGRLGRLEEAIAAFDAALVLWSRELGPDHPLIAMVRMNRGSKLRTLGRYDEALADVEAALAIDRAHLGDGHPYVAADLTTLGAIQLQRRDHAEALASFTAALAIFETVHGEGHVRTAGSHHNIGSALLGLGRLDEARDRFETALAIKRAERGEDSPNLASTLVGLGDVARLQGQPEVALERYRRALALERDAAGGETPPASGPTLRNIGLCELALGRDVAALATLERADALEAEGGYAVEVRIATRVALVDALQRAGEDERAQALAVEAREQLDALGPAFADLRAQLDAIAPTP